ncbi:MAG: metallophosphoesterase family protein [Erysipelotrichaceae bacterium]
MKFAVLGDVHGNKYALERVLADIETKAVDFVIATGDLVGYLPYPNEVVARIKEAKILVVQGNHDFAIANAQKVEQAELETLSWEEIQKSASAKFTNAVLHDANRKYLKELPTSLRLQCAGYNVLVVHGSPFSMNEYVYEEEVALKALGQTMEADVLICGHTHIAYHKEVEGKHFINAGSVGKPKHGDARSSYVVVSIDEQGVHCTIEKVAYDVAQLVKDIAQHPMIADALIPMLEQGY